MELTKLSNEADLMQKKETQNKAVLDLLIERGENGVMSFEAYNGNLNGRNIKRLPARIKDLKNVGFRIDSYLMPKHERKYVIRILD